MAKRLIAVSDSHGDEEDLRAAFEQAFQHGKIDAAIFLGDGMTDFERIMPMLFSKGTVCYAVKGNNDWATTEQPETLFTIGSVRIFACHGHTRQVKYGTDRLWYAAREREAQIVLYGHTHREKIEDACGIQFINPGAVCERSSRRSAYAEIMIEENGAVSARLVQWKN